MISEENEHCTSLFSYMVRAGPATGTHAAASGEFATTQVEHDGDPSRRGASG